MYGNLTRNLFRPSRYANPYLETNRCFNILEHFGPLAEYTSIVVMVVLILYASHAFYALEIPLRPKFSPIPTVLQENKPSRMIQDTSNGR